MRPGPYPYATDDSFVSVGNPWNGFPTKIQPSSAVSAQGWEPQDIPPADYVNWLQHRYHVQREETARALSMDFRQIPGNLTPFASPITRKYVFDQANAFHQVFSTANAVGQYQVDGSYLDGEFYSIGLTLPSKPSNANINDLADDFAGVVVAVLSGINDQVHYSTNLANYTAVTWSGGAPGSNWRHVDCDPSGPYWVITDNAGGGNIVAWYSNDGITFAALAGFPAAMGANQSISLKHSRHPASALGVDDTGNPAWICFNSVNMATSADGVTWSSAAHGLNVPTLGPDNNCKIAYSRTARRWVIPGGAGSLGSIFYSDDNGASWTTLAGVLSPTPTSIQGIESDGYGTFIVYDAQPIMVGVPVAPFGVQFWVSVDDGITWSYNVVVPALYSTSYARFDFGHFGLYDIGTPSTVQGFSMISHSGTACAIERCLIG